MINRVTLAGGGIFGLGLGLIALYLAMPQVTSLSEISLAVMALGLALIVIGIFIGGFFKLLGGNI